jgi:outer membrane protein
MPEVHAMETQLTALRKQSEDYLTSLQNEYITKYQDLLSKQDSLPENIQAMRMQELQEIENRAQNFQQASTQDYQKKEMELIAPIQEKVQKAINQVGDENGYALIISANPQILLYTGRGSIDATKLVKTKLGLN